MKKAAKSLVPGDRFIFGPEFGGEGEALTVTSAANHFGSIEIEVEEADFDIMVTAEAMLLMVVDDE
ncbi:hypothetical protein SEA_BRUHMOMENT_91 [Arthrobacter phage BruhMoment]|nr:hypothetical protein SEA_BRUHMOMENT_91 [Arthrobacter phage BruhMoment]